MRVIRLLEYSIYVPMLIWSDCFVLLPRVRFGKEQLRKADITEMWRGQHYPALPNMHDRWGNEAVYSMQHAFIIPSLKLDHCFRVYYPDYLHS